MAVLHGISSQKTPEIQVACWEPQPALISRGEKGYQTNNRSPAVVVTGELTKA
jgi:hypothetical protein